MSANPQVVTVDTTFTWDHAPQRLARGTILDVPPDSALLAAIGAHRLVPMFGAPATVAAEPAEEPQDAPEAGRESAVTVPAQVAAAAPKSPAKAAAAPDAGGGEAM
jgi:hypothetical protein